MICIAEEAIDAIKERDRLVELRSVTEDINTAPMRDARDSEGVMVVPLSDSSNDLRDQEYSQEATNDSS